MKRWALAVAALAAFGEVLFAFGFLLAGPRSARADKLESAPADSSSNSTIADTTHVYTLPTVEVIGSYADSIARRSAASQGVVTQRQIELRPMLRAGDFLESVPGMLISQHSGEGKANQYYLRGFNLDHGTDFATTIEGVPVNMPTNAHGQGYTDLNFVIPEVVGGVEYRKGTYSAEDGDFSSAGSAHISIRHTLSGPIVSLMAGEEGYRRVLVAASPQLSSGSVLGCLELVRNDGPWVHPDDYRKVNGLVRYDNGSSDRILSLIAMGYDGRWNSTDQVPERTVTSGELSRFDAIDPTDGGSTHRYSLSAEFRNLGPQSVTAASAYVLAYRLDLFSDFTYFLEDTLHGDQFEQADRRLVAGLHLSHVGISGSRDRELRQTIGLDVRADRIAGVGLYRTEARQRLTTVREDQIGEQSLSPYVQADARLLSFLRAILGVRADLYHFDVASGYQPYSGSGLEGIVSPKASLILGPWSGFDVYVNGGYGFHSDDVRGARFSDSSSGVGGVQLAAQHFPVPSAPQIQRSALLVRTKGAEVGARLSGETLGSLAATIWGLEMGSETVFLGDAALTAPSRPSLRSGIELSGESHLVDRLRLDADLAYSRARFTDSDPVGDHIPGAVEGVVSAGIEYVRPSGVFAGLRLRYFGPRPLIEDNTVRSDASTVLNAELGSRVYRRWTVLLEVFNLLDRAASDVDYYYASRLPGEPLQGVADVHTHPQGPRSVRFGISTGAFHGLP